MPVSGYELLNRLLRGYSEEVRAAANLTRHMGMAARAGDSAGFAAVRTAFEASRNRSEAWRLSIRLCREMMISGTAESRTGWSVVPPSAPGPVFALDPQEPGAVFRIHPAA
ncbi:MAG TPA: hypothetical protein VHC72_19010 [Bryobacteraceae bacterium]|nr:hypothetical protein [Bryobacteraceae bacterium]